MSGPAVAWRFLAALTLCCLVSACMQDLVDARRGKVAIVVKWPGKPATSVVGAGFTLMAIPDGTVRVEVQVRGEGIPDASPLRTVVTPNGQESSTEFLEVPIGPKVVLATALDEGGLITAEGTVVIAVQPNQLTEARVVLTATVPDPIATLAPATAAPTATPVESPLPTPVPTATPVPGPQLVIDTVAGDGTVGTADALDPLTARFKYPKSLALDRDTQALYIADTENRTIRRLDLKTGAVTTVAGRRPASGAALGAPTPEVPAGQELGTPAGLAVGPDGLLYFADRENHLIRRIQSDGSVVTVAGNGRAGYLDGAAQEASFYYPADLAFDHRGVLYVADQYNNRVRRIQEGHVTTLVGSGISGAAVDGGLKATTPTIDTPTAIALDPAEENLYIAEGKGLRILQYNLAHATLSPVVGTGKGGTAGEGGPALEASLSLPTALAFTADGELLIADAWAFKTNGDSLLGVTSRVLKLDHKGLLVRVAGQTNKAYGFGGDGSDPLRALLNNPSGLAVDGHGRIFVADSYNNRVRVIRMAQPLPELAPSAAAVPSASPTAP